jgi:hypothetical protein
VGNDESIEMFRCYICNQYKDVEDLHQITVRDLLFKKDICTECKEKLKIPQKTDGK